MDHFGTYEEFIAISRYARWLPEESRRETWSESVERYFDFFEEHIGQYYPRYLNSYQSDRLWLEPWVLDREVLPSMRALMTAGPALARDNVAGYNCGYLAVDTPRAFDELMYCLMCGTGMGFSVERQYISQLPAVSHTFINRAHTIEVRDSKIGWCEAYAELINNLYAGWIPKWDLSQVRPAGAPLKTFGGRASGPEPLEDLFNFTVRTFMGAKGRKLTSIECHDLMCKIGEVVVVGGVRRSAEISLSNLSDERMRVAKSGEWWVHDGHRRLANNSVAYTEKPDTHAFMKEWLALHDSKSGERGIFNRESAKMLAARIGRDANHEFGCNPCSEIILRPRQFCNLSEIVVRPNDTLSTLSQKAAVAAYLGTLQSTLTNFRYLSPEWKRNCDEERLLGVSMTGIMDNPRFNTFRRGLGDDLRDIRMEARNWNRALANALMINKSAAITCVKPSGTVSELVGSSSGIHPRHSQYYIRRVRGDVKDPVSQLMADSGVPHEPDVMSPDSTMVFSFPKESPKGSALRDDVTALEQLNLWLEYQQHWCDHKPSITVYVREDEWMEVGAWVYRNWEWVSGISFLPFDGGTYRQAPFEEITEEQYMEFPKVPNVDWGKLKHYEKHDTTTASHELACTAGACELR